MQFLLEPFIELLIRDSRTHAHVFHVVPAQYRAPSRARAQGYPVKIFFIPRVSRPLTRAALNNGIIRIRIRGYCGSMSSEPHTFFTFAVNVSEISRRGAYGAERLVGIYCITARSRGLHSARTNKTSIFRVSRCFRDSHE